MSVQLVCFDFDDSELFYINPLNIIRLWRNEDEEGTKIALRDRPTISVCLAIEEVADMVNAALKGEEVVDVDRG